MSGFDPVARVYRLLEYAAFGRTLHRARIAHLSHVTAARRALLIGDGDGRFLVELLRVAPDVSVVSVDASAAMLQLAQARLSDTDRARVAFHHADIRAFTSPGPFDLVVTLFSLDCFTDADAAAIVHRMAPLVSADGQWLFADFAVPARGLQRWHARFVVGALYRFFRWRTGIEARELPASQRHITDSGFHAVDTRAFRAGLIQSVRYARRS